MPTIVTRFPTNVSRLTEERNPGPQPPPRQINLGNATYSWESQAYVPLCHPDDMADENMPGNLRTYTAGQNRGEGAGQHKRAERELRLPGGPACGDEGDPGGRGEHEAAEQADEAGTHPEPAKIQAQQPRELDVFPELDGRS